MLSLSPQSSVPVRMLNWRRPLYRTGHEYCALTENQLLFTARELVGASSMKNETNKWLLDRLLLHDEATKQWLRNEAESTPSRPVPIKLVKIDTDSDEDGAILRGFLSAMEIGEDAPLEVEN
ncbi:unnamed protein product [Amoebophrya sp. A25]|nr:unnamed protein product [Amoebophrya sp. A25]|eukprot:GSA25T00019688001.1